MTNMINTSVLNGELHIWEKSWIYGQMDNFSFLFKTNLSINPLLHCWQCLATIVVEMLRCIYISQLSFDVGSHFCHRKQAKQSSGYDWLITGRQADVCTHVFYTAMYDVDLFLTAFYTEKCIIFVHSYLFFVQIKVW